MILSLLSVLAVCVGFATGHWWTPWLPAAIGAVVVIAALATHHELGDSPVAFLIVVTTAAVAIGVALRHQLTGPSLEHQAPLFCLQCGAEYRPGFTQCHDCRVPLVEQPVTGRSPVRERPVDSPRPDARSGPLELVTVLRTGDPGLIALAKSVLQSADVSFMTRGEGIQDLAGLGRLSSGYNLIFGPVEIQVGSEDADEATALLEDLEAGGPDVADAGSRPDGV